MSRIMVLLLLATVGALPRFYHGESTEVELPLQNTNRPEKMKLVYWTAMLESKNCLRNQFQCSHSDMDFYFFGNLTIKSVDTKNWDETTNPEIDLRLAFEQEKGDTHIDEVFILRNQWSLLNVKDKSGWTCRDGFVDEPLHK